MEEKRITSVQNPRVKAVVALQQKSAERRRTGLFVVEGRREVEHCVAVGMEVEELFVCEEMGAWNDEKVAVSPTMVTKSVYEKLAYRGGTEGVVAVVKSRERRLEELKLGENPLIVVVERVEKPGNLGAILRSADAAGADAVPVQHIQVQWRGGCTASPPACCALHLRNRVSRCRQSVNPCCP